MLDLLAAIVSADPPALLAWLILAFAASGYPLGIMLGSSCSACCAAPCTQCTAGELPDTITVAISGYVDGQAQGADLASLAFTSNFGSGAAGKVTAPGGTPGPITGVSVTSGGEGYARLARVQPTVTASASGGTGATFSVSLNQITYEDRPAWEVASLTITNGGTGYPASGYVTFNTASGDTAEQSADATFYSGRVAPTVTASVSGSGSGAALSASLSSATGYDGRTYWYVSGISITNGGTGYAEYDPVAVTVTDGEGYGAYAEVSAVDGSGAITGIAVYWGGEYFKSNGVIQSVQLSGGGIYYRDDASLPSEKATVSVSVIQTRTTAAVASGAVLVAVIDDNPASPTFGQIAGATITSGGNYYLAWAYRNLKCCEDYWNGMSVVLKRGKDSTGADAPCVYSHAMCGTTCGASVVVAYRGPNLSPFVHINSHPDCTATFMTTPTLISNCDEFSFTATHPSGVTAEVSPGGSYDATFKADNGTGRCSPCCRANEDPPGEVEVQVSEKNATSPDDWGAPSSMDEIPTVVLQKGVDGTLDEGSYFGYCTQRWGGSLPNGYKVVVWIDKCNSYDGVNCDHCWKKCETRARVQTIFNCTGTTNPDRGNSPSCENCQESPMCAPATGDYDITESVLGGGLCNVSAIRVSVQ